MDAGTAPPNSLARSFTVRAAYLGFGHVNRALDALIEARRADLAREYGLTLTTVGIATRRGGWRAGDTVCRDIGEWLDTARPDIVFEAIPLNALAGQPALDYCRASLEHGAHVISANKGPIVYGYRELTAIAAKHGRAYCFEAAVMDGAPVFSLVRDCLPLAGLRSIRGVFTSTTTIVLEAVERSHTMADGIAEAQRLGIAEEDPSDDVDGWDSAVKLCALANVLFGAELRPGDVSREGIRNLREVDVRLASAEGKPYRLVGEVGLTPEGSIAARVAPERCAPDGTLGVVHGATLVSHYDAEVFPGGLTVTSRDPDPTTTAYGLFADMIRALGTN